MNHYLPKGKIYVSASMRGGSSMVTNILNAHSDIMVLGEYIHFFRFIYKHYEPLNKNNVEIMLREMKARLYWRYRVDVDIETILNEIDKDGYIYSAIYNAILRSYLKKLGKSIAGEDAALSWHDIPEYLHLFPEGKVVQIARDPRAVLASWRKSSYQKICYLDAIFNCIDNIDKCLYYEKVLPKENYIYVKYEEIILNPEEEVKRICNFIGVDFQPLMIQPERWNEIFDGVYVKRGISSHIGRLNKGFDASRIDTWKNSLEEWELCLCEWLAGDRLKKMGYELSNKSFDSSSIYKGIDIIRNHPFLFKRFNVWLASNKGGVGYPDDPRNPATWGASTNKASELTRLFVETDDGKSYLKEIQDIRRLMR